MLKNESSKKTIVSIFLIGIILLVLSPITENFSEKPKDDFPLSYYPMFSFERNKETYVTHVIAVDLQNKKYVVPHYIFLPGSGFNAGRKQIIRIIMNGEEKKLCNEIARNVKNYDHQNYDAVRWLIILTSVIDIDSYMRRENKYVNKDLIHYRCEIN